MKSPARTPVALVLPVFWLATASHVDAQNQPRPLITSVTRTESALSASSTVKRAGTVQFHPEVLGGAGEPTGVQIKLFSDVAFEATLCEVPTQDAQRRLWRGRLEGRPLSSVIIVSRNGIAAGAIHAGVDGTFEVRPAATGDHEVRQLASGPLLACGGIGKFAAARKATKDTPEAPAHISAVSSEAAPPGALEAGFIPPASTCDDGSVIDLMVVYTQAAVTAAGGTAAIEALIDLAVADTNEAFTRSLIDTSIRLVHTQQISYAESGLGDVDGPRLVEPNDGYLDDVLPLRDAYGADCVSLWVDSLDSGGIGYYPHASMTGIGASGYTVMRQDNAAGLTLAHELGHNLWCAHDRDNDSPPPPFAEYSHGYREPAAQWHTIMAYPPGFTIPYFANPSVNYPGPVNPGPTGIAANQPLPCNVALTINQTRLIVAGFRATRITGLPSVLYVRATAAPGGDGLGWVTAFNDLQEAICRAGGSNGDVEEIWVAQGTYRADAGSADRDRSFVLANGLALYGGFDGTESARDQRDPLLNPTTLSGDIGIPGDAADNSYHVVLADHTDATALLDGFIVSDGYADSPDWPGNLGGGLFVEAGSPTIRNCRFQTNYAVGGGGGLGTYQAAPTIDGCIFRSNDGGDWGGGAILNYTDTASTISTCLFESNTALFGGAVLNAYNCGGSIIGCMFRQNTVTPGNNAGGGLYCLDSSSPLVEDCTFEENIAQYGAAVAMNANCLPTIRGCTFDQNQGAGAGSVNAAIDAYLGCDPVIEACTFTANSADYGAAIGLSDTCDPTIHTCTFAGNSAVVGGGVLYLATSCSPKITACTFEDNDADWGAVLVGGDFSTPRFSDCLFRGNTAASGGGVANLYSFSDAEFDRCIFASNSADYAGVLVIDTQSAPLLTNCLFSGNSAGFAGVAAAYGASTPRVVNCTAVGNQADFVGGFYATQATPVFQNSILWANSDFNGVGETSQVLYDAAVPDLSFSTVQGWTGSMGGVQNSGSDPVFVDADGVDNTYGTDDDDARLQPGSPAVNSGDNPLVPAGVLLDLTGSPRILEGVVDRGAYERIPPIPGDFDHDGDVDADDLAEFVDCGTGPELGPPVNGCTTADLDGDGDIDSADFGVFQRCISGTGEAGDPDCAS